LLVGLDPLRTEVVHELCETVDFHHGRPWTVEVAVWDLVGRALGLPCWRLLGGRSERLLAYASSAEPLATEERVARVLALRDVGIRAVKLRFHHADWREDVTAVAAVRAAAGPELEIMVDANQGWRMPGDLAPAWDLATARACAAALEPLRIHWLEEPLPTADVDGYAALVASTNVPIAAGEMVRQEHEARDLLTRGGIAVIQCDVLFCGGIGGCRRIADLAGKLGRSWSPHTWSNGYGLVANLHAACALSNHGYVEVPYDPPAWSAERRDWMLPVVIEIAGDGTIAPPPGPGLGIEPDLDALERWRVG
jgi:L-alanine-DL-glutamate epimerase-like enolase superfamily enzyme